ncbi:ABC transporter permease [Clostridium cylindrosporum]|uniref:ABC-type multidrug transport system, permease component n=1 Tax=Clostridium cylindrosporum DSM 605 TaxID=1121307 RepID=A0A0J8G6G7_CLOCY|nr:ABC transporter permease [Clostridium cylindrosporum]KMT23201.1 ABC-type multidrug transport system, permease component [Clostridium cylindrosporum DSM 605]
MRSFTVAKRIIKQIKGDKRSLGLLIVAPIFVIFLLNVILNSSLSRPKLEIINLPSKVKSELEKKADIVAVKDRYLSFNKLKNREIDGIVEFANGGLKVSLEGSETDINGVVKKSILESTSNYTKEIVSDVMKYSKLKIKPIEIEFQYINGNENMSLFDSIAPMMMGFFIFFFVFLMAGIAFLRERISGTLDRLLATPIKRIEIVFGYFWGFGFFVLIQTLVIQLFMIYGLNLIIEGSFLSILIVNVLLAAVSLSLGTFLSAFAKNEFQLIQFIPIVIVPQILFCGLFSLREAPLWVSILSKVFPLTYGADALRSIAIRGASLKDIYLDIVVLIGYTLVFIILNSLVLKKYRRI